MRLEMNKRIDENERFCERCGNPADYSNNLCLDCYEDEWEEAEIQKDLEELYK